MYTQALILWQQVIALHQCVPEGMSNIAVMSSTWEFPIPSSTCSQCFPSMRQSKKSTTLRKKPQRINVRQFIRQVEQINI